MRIFIFSIILFNFATGCHRSAGVGDDADNDTHSDSADSDSQTGGTDSSDDNDSESASDYVDDTDSNHLTGAQPLTFIIENQTDQTVILRANSGLHNMIECADSSGESYYLGEIWCASSCDSFTPEDPCGILCEYYPGVLIIEPHEQFEVYWNGVFHNLQQTYCSDGGSCQFNTVPATGDYSFSVSVYSEYQCAWEDSCQPGQEGIIWGAEVIGESTECSVDHILPSQEDIHLIISLP